MDSFLRSSKSKKTRSEQRSVKGFWGWQQFATGYWKGKKLIARIIH
jgi:hypothetical protein